MSGENMENDQETRNMIDYVDDTSRREGSVIW
jgi:hypothetical protein